MYYYIIYSLLYGIFIVFLYIFIYIYIAIGQLGLAAWLCSLPALFTACLLAEHGKLKKALNFLGTTENISVLSTLFSYKIQTLQLLGR